MSTWPITCVPWISPITISKRFRGAAIHLRSSSVCSHKPDRYPLVFHCAAGRDRTGVAAALVLLAAGIDRDAIIADYLLSDGFLAGRLERWRLSFVARGVEPAPILDNVRPRPAYLLPVLDAIDNEFGGIDRYLNSIVVSDEELASFRCLVLAPSI